MSGDDLWSGLWWGWLDDWSSFSLLVAATLDEDDEGNCTDEEDTGYLEEI